MTIRRALEPTDYPFFDYRRFSFALGIAATKRIWLSGSTAVRHLPPEGMVVKGDLVAQAGVIYDKMRATLVPANRGLTDVTRMVRYVTPKAIPQLAALDDFQRETFGGNVSTTTLIVQSLLRPEALIEIEGNVRDGGDDGITHWPSIIAADHTAAWAEADKMLAAQGLSRHDIAKATELASPSAFDAKAPASGRPGLRVMAPRLATAENGVQLDIAVAAKGSRVVYVSADADPSKEGIVEQCRDLYANLAKKLEAAGASLGTVVKTTEFITATGLRDYRGTADVRRDVFAAPYPAATGVICAGLGHPGALIAVEATALTEAG